MSSGSSGQVGEPRGPAEAMAAPSPPPSPPLLVVLLVLPQLLAPGETAATLSPQAGGSGWPSAGPAPLFPTGKVVPRAGQHAYTQTYDMAKSTGIMACNR